MFFFYVFLWNIYVESKGKIIGGKSERVMENPVKFEGVSEEVQKMLDANMDQVGPRRRAREAFKDTQLSIDHVLFKVLNLEIDKSILMEYIFQTKVVIFSDIMYKLERMSWNSGVVFVFYTM